MNKKITGVIFDMDGVLFDTERMYCELWTRICREKGIPATIEIAKRHSGMTSEAAYPMMAKLFGAEHDFREIDRIVLELALDDIRENGVPLKPDLHKALEYIKNSGYKTAVATSAVKEVGTFMLTAGGAIEYFDKLVFGDSVKNSKPAPDIYLKAAEELGLNPSECIVVEDSVAGLKSANAAGMLPVMAPDLTEPNEELRSFIFAVVYSFSELINLIDSLRADFLSSGTSNADLQ